MPEANDPSGVSAGYVPQTEFAEFVPSPLAGDLRQHELFYSDSGHDFFQSEVVTNDDVDPFYGLVRQDAPYSNAAISGPDYAAGTGRPTIAAPGLYGIYFGITVVSFHDSDFYTLSFSTGDIDAFDEASALRRKALSYNGARVTLGVNFTVYLDESYADGSTQWGNVKLFRHTGGAATPTINGYTFAVSKLGD